MDLNKGSIGVPALEAELRHARKKFWCARDDATKEKWRRLAESLYNKLADQHEKNKQSVHPELTMRPKLNLAACIRQIIQNRGR